MMERENEDIIEEEGEVVMEEDEEGGDQGKTQLGGEVEIHSDTSPVEEEEEEEDSSSPADDT